jgi:hypothetical protein
MLWEWCCAISRSTTSSASEPALSINIADFKEFSGVLDLPSAEVLELSVLRCVAMNHRPVSLDDLKGWSEVKTAH